MTRARFGEIQVGDLIDHEGTTGKVERIDRIGTASIRLCLESATTVVGLGRELITVERP